MTNGKPAPKRKRNKRYQVLELIAHVDACDEQDAWNRIKSCFPKRTFVLREVKP